MSVEIRIGAAGPVGHVGKELFFTVMRAPKEVTAHMAEALPQHDQKTRSGGKKFFFEFAGRAMAVVVIGIRDEQNSVSGTVRAEQFEGLVQGIEQRDILAK